MRKFTKNNQTFLCIECHQEVIPHPTSSRDHCNNCLTGLHVDIFPGDRQNTCQGKLIPVGIQTSGRKTQILYECERCRKRIQNIVAPDDNYDMIVEISTK